MGMERKTKGQRIFWAGVVVVLVVSAAMAVDDNVHERNNKTTTANGEQTMPGP